jgi:multiple RNA-binding domain-containing protein 1
MKRYPPDSPLIDIMLTDAMKQDAINENADEAPPASDDPMRATILRTSRLFLRNLAFSCTEADLEEHFRRFGDVSQV